jgi:hypothetical protein
VQFELFIAGLKIANLDKSPRKAPTGQTVLQYNLPLKELNTITPAKTKNAKKKEPAVNSA